ncbi:hypothetical protein [Breoghania sp.]|uniref:hypothetical protein n=1 Tax=Breoghania sp. TaxID=2065378 RepID=UPI0026112805|nr:hypothetical protein [Breoghania sp.]MDJ0932103.1 hypothetical protein [Breoghania sp.]
MESASQSSVDRTLVMPGGAEIRPPGSLLPIFSKTSRIPPPSILPLQSSAIFRKPRHAPTSPRDTKRAFQDAFCPEMQAEARSDLTAGETYCIPNAE